MRFFFLTFFAFALVGCAIPEPDSKPQPAVSKEPEAPEPPDLISEDVKVGTGPEAKKGDHVLVHYTGKLAKNGKQFDSSIGKEPLPVTLGEGGVIEGWDKGLVGMKVGGKRKLTIPSRLAYKDKGSGQKIPPNATLIFDVELVKIGEDKKDEKSDDDGEDKDKGDKDKKDKKDDGKKDDKKKVEKDDKKDAKKDDKKKDEPKKEPKKEEKKDEKKPAKP